MPTVALTKKEFSQRGGVASGVVTTVAANTSVALYTGGTYPISGATFDVGANTGLTSYTFANAGDYNIILHIPAWDGTGPKNSKGHRTMHFKIGGQDAMPNIVQGYYPMANMMAGAYVGTSAATRVYVGATLVYSASTTPAPSGDRTLVVQGVQEAMMDLQDRYCQMYNIFDFASSFDSMTMEPNNSLTTYSPFSGSYADGEITVTGPFSGSSYTVHCEGIGMSACESISNYITFSFSASSATIQADYTSETDPECECIEAGGEWDGSDCIFPEHDPCIDDPCSCDPNPDECYCIQNGGTWDGSECIYPE